MHKHKPVDKDGIYDVFLFSYDVVNYSGNKSFEQVQIQEKLDALLEQSVPEESFIGFNDEGDGGFVLLDGKILDITLTCLRKFDTLLRASQQGKELSFQVRYALHEGRVAIRKRPLGGIAYSGTAINECRRMISGMPDSKPGQVLCSSKHKETLIQDAGIEEQLFTDLSSFRVKNTVLANTSSYFDGETGYDWSSKLIQKEREETKQLRKQERFANVRRTKKRLSATATNLFWAILILSLAILWLAPQ